MNLNKLIYLLFFLPLLICSCGDKIKTVKDFTAYMNDPKNELKLSKSVNGVLVTVMYLPAEYVSLKELENSDGIKNVSMYNSLLEQNKQTLSFLMVLGPDESKSKDDIMYKGLSNFKEYVKRSMSLNFDLEEKVELHTNATTYVPILSSLENTYGLSKDRKVNFVFAPVEKKDELINAKQLDFVYHDETFGVGTLHFSFDKEKIEDQLPVINIE